MTAGDKAVVAGVVGVLVAAQSTGSSRAFLPSTNRGDTSSYRRATGGQTVLRGGVRRCPKEHRLAMVAIGLNMAAHWRPSLSETGGKTEQRLAWAATVASVPRLMAGDGAGRSGACFAMAVEYRPCLGEQRQKMES